MNPHPSIIERMEDDPGFRDRILRKWDRFGTLANLLARRKYHPGVCDDRGERACRMVVEVIPVP